MQKNVLLLLMALLQIAFVAAQNPVIRYILTTDAVTHPGVIDFKGKSYFFYHDGSMSSGSSYRHSVKVDYLHYNSDRAIGKIVETEKGVSKVN